MPPPTHPPPTTPPRCTLTPPFPAIYEIGARGQLLVAARHKSDGSTDKVLLSADQGACWAEVALPEAMYIENIRRATP